MADPSSNTNALVISNLRFAYPTKPDLLAIPGLTIARGARVFIFGPSGSGKTTLLGIIAGVLSATTGEVRVLEHELTHMSGVQRDAFRGVHLGYIFQLFNLIPYLDVFANITLPCRLHAERRKRLGARSLADTARDLTTRLGIDHLRNANVTTLSVGQQQRVAAARALLGAPELLIADEPTSALDTDQREQFLTLLFECCRDTNATLICVSHDRQLTPLFDRALSLPDLNVVGKENTHGSAVAHLPFAQEPQTRDQSHTRVNRLEHGTLSWR